MNLHLKPETLEPSWTTVFIRRSVQHIYKHSNRRSWHFAPFLHFSRTPKLRSSISSHVCSDGPSWRGGGVYRGHNLWLVNYLSQHWFSLRYSCTSLDIYLHSIHQQKELDACFKSTLIFLILSTQSWNPTTPSNKVLQTFVGVMGHGAFVGQHLFFTYPDLNLGGLKWQNIDPPSWDEHDRDIKPWQEL